MNAQLHTHAKAEYSERVEMNDSMTTKTAASIQIRVHIKKCFYYGIKANMLVSLHSLLFLLCLF